ncbi:NAD(P)H-binding protein [Chitinophaga polysaccharea]|uniref:NmrA family NAD(P)-binding protein n=1 Tax=Chitinophaga TaxID=79328 RepID=UPI001455296F|nr:MULTISPECIES: NAD(P)H-binding protein [Chitinophaga]NLR57572.1 NAD(P)H-binding protein [Chitinophaga polysaccharea]NLU95486.1 NAD(P)H-binding protein [Chitinophaga sp. Ak27]
MNITITGSLGNISKPLTEQLIAKGHRVTVVSHRPERAAAIEALQAIPAIGAIEDAAFLRRTFEGADAVYLMIPPGYAATDIHAYMKAAGDRYATAIAQAGVKYVVNLSSIGAHTPDGAGPAGANYHIEQQLNALTGTQVLHLRPGMFYSNFLGSIPMIKHQRIIGNNFDAATPVVLSHPADIAAVAATALDTLNFSGKEIRYVASDEKTGAEIATLLGAAAGQPDLAWVHFPDEALMAGLMESGLSEQMAKVYVVEIGIALRDGSLLNDYRQQEKITFGPTSFADFAREFGEIYKNN